jgi:hypothetical protein
MKFRLFVIALVGVLACKKDNDVCTPPSVGTNIIGSWNGYLKSYEKLVSSIVFNSDGDYTESNGTLFSNFDSPKMKWEFKGDSLRITATHKESKTNSYVFSVTKNDCDTIKLDLEGLDEFILIRD